MTTPSVTKRSIERRIFEVNVGPAMRDEDSILDVVSIDAGADITIDDIEHTAGVIAFRASGGSEGSTYPTTIIFNTRSDDTSSTAEQVLEVCFNIIVSRPC